MRHRIKAAPKQNNVMITCACKLTDFVVVEEMLIL
jgi:hypothetical protein